MSTKLDDKARRAWIAVAASAEVRAFVAECLGFQLHGTTRNVTFTLDARRTGDVIRNV